MWFFMLVVSVFFSFLNSVSNFPQACFRYTDSGNCRECFPGYMGANCSHTCRYPSYGKGCQGVCHCERVECHAVIGCSQSTDCQPGYFGFNCIHQCRFPTYGLNCQEICGCDVQHCNKETGCMISTPDIASTTNERGKPPNDRTMTSKLISRYNHTLERKATTRILLKSTPSLLILSVTYYVKNDISSLSTKEQMVRSTVMGVDRHENKTVLSNSTNPMYAYIVPLTGIFIILIVVFNIFVLLRRRKMCPNNNSTRYLHTKKRNIGFDRDRTLTHTANQTDANNSQYEMINFDSDDSDSITFLKIHTPFETGNKRPALSSSFISGSSIIIDADGYQCPISNETSEKTMSRDTNLDNYLTVVY